MVLHNTAKAETFISVAKAESIVWGRPTQETQGRWFKLTMDLEITPVADVWAASHALHSKDRRGISFKKLHTLIFSDKLIIEHQIIITKEFVPVNTHCFNRQRNSLIKQIRHKVFMKCATWRWCTTKGGCKRTVHPTQEVAANRKWILSQVWLAFEPVAPPWHSWPGIMWLCAHRVLSA